MKWSSFLQRSTLCLNMIGRKLDTVETNCTIFYHTLKLKICNSLKKNPLNMVIHIQIQAENRVITEALHLNKE